MFFFNYKNMGDKRSIIEDDRSAYLCRIGKNSYKFSTVKLCNDFSHVQRTANQWITEQNGMRHGGGDHDNTGKRTIFICNV